MTHIKHEFIIVFFTLSTGHSIPFDSRRENMFNEKKTMNRKAFACH
jgi:hypothetical protein